MIKARLTYADMNPHNNKWYVCFDVYRNRKEHIITSELCSAQVFYSKDEALAGGARAIEILEKTGKWPDMCQPF